ncbi:hypothetical protein M8494_15740 [Serratia ureilytica]
MGLLYEKAPSPFSIPRGGRRSADWAGSAPGNDTARYETVSIIVMFWLLFFRDQRPLPLDDDTLNVRLVDAMFEGLGITTTGASVLNDVSNIAQIVPLLPFPAPDFIGGLGVIVLAVAVLPLLGISGQTFTNQMPGPFERPDATTADTSKKPVVDPWAGVGLYRRLSSGGHAVVRCAVPRHFHRVARRIFHP